MKKFEGRVVVITGGASGIGRETAKMFAAEGANVVITTSRNWEGLQETAAMVEELGGSALPILADASSEADWDKTVQMIIEKYGKINYLINNAGRRPFGGVETATMENLLDAFKYDCFSVFIGMNRCVPYMKKVREAGEEAAIVNVTSFTAKGGAPEYLCYVSAKAATIAMTKCAAADLCDTGIRVNTLLPGLIDTPIIQDRPKKDLDGFVDQFMIKRKGKPEEIAAGITYLCSDEAKYIDAAELTIDGGFTGTRSYK